MKLEEISDKLVELYGQWVKIHCNLTKLDKDVEANPINITDSGKSTEPREVPSSKWPNK